MEVECSSPREKTSQRIHIRPRTSDTAGGSVMVEMPESDNELSTEDQDDLGVTVDMKTEQPVDHQIISDPDKLLNRSSDHFTANQASSPSQQIRHRFRSSITPLSQQISREPEPTRMQNLVQEIDDFDQNTSIQNQASTSSGQIQQPHQSLIAPLSRQFSQDGQLIPKPSLLQGIGQFICDLSISAASILDWDRSTARSIEDRLAVIVARRRSRRKRLESEILHDSDLERELIDSYQFVYKQGELNEKIDFELQKLLDKRIRKARLPPLGPKLFKNQVLFYPDLDPVPEMLESRTGTPNVDPQDVAYSLLESTSSNFVEFDLSRCSGAKQLTINLDELTLIRAFNLDFNNRWMVDGNLVDYTTIRFLDWNPDWPVDRAPALTGLRMRELKRIKIYGQTRGVGGVETQPMANLLSVLTTFPKLLCVEIDRLHLAATASKLRFPRLQVLSIDSIEVMDGDRVVTNQTNQKHLTIDAPELEEVYLGK